jgi:hypothetical protein
MVSSGLILLRILRDLREIEAVFIEVFYLTLNNAWNWTYRCITKWFSGALMFSGCSFVPAIRGMYQLMQKNPSLGRTLKGKPMSIESWSASSREAFSARREFQHMMSFIWNHLARLAGKNQGLKSNPYNLGHCLRARDPSREAIRPCLSDWILLAELPHLRIARLPSRRPSCKGLPFRPFKFALIRAVRELIFLPVSQKLNEGRTVSQYPLAGGVGVQELRDIIFLRILRNLREIHLLNACTSAQ